MQVVQEKETSRAAWLAERRTGIGGSDIAAIMGLSPWKTPYEVWLDKTGQQPDGEETPAMYWGTQLEDLVAQEYARRTGFKIQRVNTLMRSNAHPFMIANIDRAVVNPDISGVVRWNGKHLTTDRILECKTANGFAAEKWGEPGSDFVPEQYLLQCQWYMEVTNANFCDLAVLIGGNDYRVYNLKRDQELIDMMIEAAADFWGCVQRNEPPPPINASECAARFKRSDPGTTAVVNADAMQAAQELQELAMQIKELEARENELKGVIMSQMADKEVAEHMGIPIATWKNQVSKRLDTTRLKKEKPEIAAQYTTESESRVFRLKKGA